MRIRLPRKSRAKVYTPEELEFAYLECISSHWHMHRLPVSEGYLNRRWVIHLKALGMNAPGMRRQLVRDKKVKTLISRRLAFYLLPLDAWNGLVQIEREFFTGYVTKAGQGRPKGRREPAATSATVYEPSSPMEEFE